MNLDQLNAKLQRLVATPAPVEPLKKAADQAVSKTKTQIGRSPGRVEFATTARRDGVDISVRTFGPRARGAAPGAMLKRNLEQARPEVIAAYDAWIKEQL